MSDYRNGSVIGVDNTPTTMAASGIWDMNAVAAYEEQGVWPSVMTDAVLTYIGANSAGVADPHTFAGEAIGTAAPDRYVAVGVRTNVGTISSVTIGGNAATKVLNLADAEGEAAIFMLLVTSGTTADIVVDLSTSATCSIGVWTVNGLVSTTPTDSFTSTSDPGSGVIDVTAGGFVIGIAYDAVNAPNITWSEVTERYEHAPGGVRCMSGADKSYAAAQTNLAVSADYASASSPRTLVGSWR